MRSTIFNEKYTVQKVERRNDSATSAMRHFEENQDKEAHDNKPSPLAFF